ncbi:MAG: hypothetical protein JOZ62_05620 [Acidobacteriaceae bacterium]|nr:hypothetical protein [Acidobacteriaceae bacterium]
MYEFLFAEPVVDRKFLRAQARAEVVGAPLLRACSDGDPAAVRALVQGAWPFVEAFESAIDLQVKRLPIRPLMARFGQVRIKHFFAQARAAVREMREEEGSHAALWRDSADELGVDLNHVEIVQGVRALLEGAEAADPVEFFCWLAGTEYIAEELAAYLCGSPAFVNSFRNGRWRWGEAHTRQHEGASHLEIDEDLARAYHPAADPAIAAAALSAWIKRCFGMFGASATDIMAYYLTNAAAA